MYNGDTVDTRGRTRENCENGEMVEKPLAPYTSGINLRGLNNEPITIVRTTIEPHVFYRICNLSAITQRIYKLARARTFIARQFKFSCDSH